MVAAAAATLAERFPDARFLPALRRANVHGALDMGLAPGLLPGGSPSRGRGWFSDAWGAVPAGRGRDAAGMLAALADGEHAALVLVRGDPLADFPDVEPGRRGPRAGRLRGGRRRRS